MHDAFALIKNTAESTMKYEITDGIKRQEQTYAYMLSYLTAGADDPQRGRLLDDIVAETYYLLDCLVVALMQPETPTLYYNVRRYAGLAGQSQSQSLKTAIVGWHDAVRKQTDLNSLFDKTGEAITDDSAERNLFNAVWTSFPMHADRRRELVDIVTDSATGLVSAMRITSALGLAVSQFADSNVIEALCDIYLAFAADESRKGRQVAVAALVGLVIAIYKYSDRLLPLSTRNSIATVRDTSTWAADIRVVFMELVRSRDTERISHTMKTQIIPGMVALRPEIEKKMRDMGITPESFDEMQANPEWEDILAKSGLEDKLKQLSELQMEGSDVFMSTFSHLKNFPFFNDVVNWFTPMTMDNVEVDKIISAEPGLHDVVALIDSLPFLCDSDKFSMLQSLSILPREQRTMMLSQINAQRDRLDELRSNIDGITRVDNRRNDVRNYLRNLYRFLNLFRRKGEFYNIFVNDVNLLSVPMLSEDLRDENLLKLVGEFYFKRAYYDDALKAFGVLDDMNLFDATLYQKMGYAYEKTGDIDNAIRLYEQADLLDSQSRWLKIRLATVYRATGRISEAVKILTALAEANSEDTEVELMLGYTFVRLEDYTRALKHFYKIEFLDENSGRNGQRTVRPIAWSLFMSGDFAKAAGYYSRLPAETLTGEDYLNMGHVALARNMMKDAINNYKLYILAAANDKEAFFKALEQDRVHLQRVGVEPNTISLVADALLYDLG